MKTFVMILLLAILGACGLNSQAEEATRCSTRQAEYDEANIRRCTARLALPGLSNEERAMTFNARGNNYDELKQYDLAIADYSEVIRLLPKFEYGYANRALEKYKKGEFQAAVADYDHALIVNSKSLYALYGRGLARIKAGNAIGGKADLATANQQDPNMASVYRSIGITP